MSTLALNTSSELRLAVSHEVKEDLLHAAVAGHSDELLALLERFPVPADWRDLAHSLAMSGGHYHAANLLKPSLH